MKMIIPVLTVIIIFMIITGCSPSSSSIRYAKEKETIPEDRDSVIRFTSLDDLPLSGLNRIDSLCCGEEEFDSEDPDDSPDDNPQFDISEIMKRYGSVNSENSLSLEQITHRERMIMEIIKYMNTPYKFGGNSMKGIDCSAFTQTVFRDATSIALNRSAREQFTQGETITDKSELKFGDLVFFNTRRRVRPGHVGIYIGDNLFAHASTKLGVTISSLNHNYYSARYMGARRLDDNGIF